MKIWHAPLPNGLRARSVKLSLLQVQHHRARIISLSGKKNRASRAALSSESDAWIAFRSFDSANSLRTVPASASAGSVAPIATRNAATASAFSRTIGMHGPDVMKLQSDP